jgi:hypothetical protein
MSDEWYSLKPRTRFSREHRDCLPGHERMVDVDQVLWVPYVGFGTAALLAEVKPEAAREDFWIVTRSLAQACGLPAAKIIEKTNGTYKIYVASALNGYEPHCVGDDLSIQDWYERVEQPL